MSYGCSRMGVEPSEGRGSLVGAGRGVAVADGGSAGGGGEATAVWGGDIEFGGGLMAVGGCGEGQDSDRNDTQPESSEQEQERHHAGDAAASIPARKSLVIKGGLAGGVVTLAQVGTGFARGWDRLALRHVSEGVCCTFNGFAMQEHHENTTFGVFSSVRKLESLFLQGVTTFGIGMERKMPKEVVDWLVRGETNRTSLVQPEVWMSAVTTYRDGNWRSKGRECAAAASPRRPQSRGDTGGGGADSCGLRPASVVAFGARRGGYESDAGRARSGSDFGCGAVDG
ncbi:MAG: hypothetical protein RI897_4137 [Verrucomicrobiota bacterium]